MYVSAVILPDSTVFETGGASTTIHNGNKPVFSAQIFDPKTSTWTKVASPTVPRVYHSSALLLPDGRGRDLRRQPGRRLRDAGRDLHAAVPADEHAAPDDHQRRRPRSPTAADYAIGTTQASALALRGAGAARRR